MPRYGEDMETRPSPPAGSTRRELLKLSPVLLLGAFAVPSLRQTLLESGVALSDRVSAAAFRPSHLAPTFSARDVVPFERFPYNYSSVVDPGVDLESWALQVSGAVAHPGAYRLADFASLPRVRQNTRLVCVEG